MGKGKSFACGVAQNVLEPCFYSPASQWEESLQAQITRAQNHKQKQNGEMPTKEKKSNVV